MISDATTRSGIDPDEMPAVVEARTRLYVAQEQHKRLETRRLAGELLEADDVRARLLELAQLLVGALEGLPVRAAADAASAQTAAEAAATLREHCNAARDELADRIEALAKAAENSGNDHPPATTANGGAVGRRGAN